MTKKELLRSRITKPKADFAKMSADMTMHFSRRLSYDMEVLVDLQRKLNNHFGVR